MCRPHASWIQCAKLAACAAALLLLATPSARAAGLLVADGGFGGALEIKQQDTHVTINNGVVVTEVEQVFVNTEKRVVEALYTFPVPEKASVANFSMWINGKEMTGEVVEKQRARKIYESYKQVRRDPGLLEQVDFKTFEMRIFPIAAGAEQRVRITYYQELNFDHDSATYVYPLATTSLKKMDQKTTGRFSLLMDVKSEVPLVELKSPSHPDEFVIVKHDDDHYWQASLEAREGNLNRDLVIAFQTERPRTGLDLIASRSGQEDGYFLMTLTAGKELEASLGGADYVFLLDVSGSMGYDGKLNLSRGALAAFVSSLSAEDRFELITFNVGAKTLFGSLSPVNDQTRAAAAEFLKSQRAVGGTVLGPAIQAAYRYNSTDRPLNVVVLSDGLTELREQRELLELIGQRPKGSTVFCVGVGNDVNRPLLSQLANEAGGLAAFLSAGDDFQRQAEAFRRKLTRPAGKDVKISFDGGDVYDVEPQQLSNLYYGQPLRIYGRFRNAGATTVRVKADVLGNVLDQKIEVQLPKQDESNPEIERMWAWHRLERLSGEARRTGSVGQQPEIVRLCEGYSIASEWASFIVLENDAEFARWKIERRNATRVQRDQRAQQALRQKLEELRRQSQASLGPAAADSAAKPSAVAQNQVADRPATARPDPLPSAPAVQPNPPVAQRDLFVGKGRTGGGGGGAIDPVTALAAMGLAGMGWAARRRALRRTPGGRSE